MRTGRSTTSTAPTCRSTAQQVVEPAVAAASSTPTARRARTRAPRSSSSSAPSIRVAYFIDTNTLTNPGKTALRAVPADAGSGQRAGAAGDAGATAEGSRACRAAVRRAHVLAGAAPYDLAGARDRRSVPADHAARPVSTNCTADPTEPPSPCPEPDTRVDELRRAAQHGVPDHRPRTCRTTATRGDMVHRFFHMWQQSDCDAAHATAVGSGRLPQRSLSLRRHRARRRLGQQLHGLLQRAARATRRCSSAWPTSTR